MKFIYQIMKLNLKYVLLAIFIFFLFVVFSQFYSILSFPDMSWNLDKDEKIDMKPEKPVIQKFIARQDNLSRIEILFGNSKISPGANIKMQLLDENCSNVIRSKNLEVKSLDSDAAYEFKFSTIKDSKDKTYCLNLNFTPKENKGKKYARIFTVPNTSPENVYFFDFTKDQEIKNRSLAIRPAYKTESVWKDMEKLNQRMSQYKPWFLKHYYLYAIAFGFLILSIALVTILILI